MEIMCHYNVDIFQKSIGARHGLNVVPVRDALQLPAHPA
jgi:hypothetical protein